MCRVPEIGGGDWKRSLSDSSDVWHYQLVGGGWSESQSRWHVSDSGILLYPFLHHRTLVHRTAWTVLFTANH